MCFNKVSYVVFAKSTTAKWYFKHVFDSTISHCFVIEEQPIGDTIVHVKTEHLFSHVDISLLFMTIEDIMKLLKDEINYSIIKVETSIKTANSLFLFPAIDCVALTKRLLGINKPLLFTPKQLYIYLLNNYQLMYSNL